MRLARLMRLPNVPLQTSPESANSLATESFRQEQRADLYIAGLTLTREPEPESPTTTAVLVLRNNGRTAAKAVYNLGAWGYTSRSANLNLGSGTNFLTNIRPSSIQGPPTESRVQSPDLRTLKRKPR